MNNYDEATQKARNKGNKFALMIDTKQEKLVTEKLLKLKEEREQITQSIIDIISKHQERLFKILNEEQELEEQVYQISGEWGLDNFNKQHPETNAQKLLYDLTDGVIFGWNLDDDARQSILNDIKEIQSCGSDKHEI